MRLGWGLLTAWVAITVAAPVAAQGEVIPRREPQTTAGQSLLVPGWGQRTNDEPNKGLAYFGGALVTLAMALDLIELGEGNDQKLIRGIGIVGYAAIATSAAYDAYRTSQRLNRENGYDLVRASPRGVRIVLLARRF